MLDAKDFTICPMRDGMVRNPKARRQVFSYLYGEMPEEDFAGITSVEQAIFELEGLADLLLSGRVSLNDTWDIFSLAEDALLATCRAMDCLDWGLIALEAAAWLREGWLPQEER